MPKTQITKQTSLSKKIKSISCPKAFVQWATAFVLCSSLFGCSNAVFDETVSIKDGQWLEADSVLFEVNIEDIQQAYDIFLYVDHDVNYPYQNTYCLVQTYTPEGALAQHSVAPLELADKKGNWKADNCGSENCVRKIPFIPKTTFPATGTYKIVLKQYSRIERLEGINSLRLTVEPYTPPNS